MTAPDITGLIAALDAIEQCCADGDWEAAAARLALHDREVRALHSGAHDAASLQLLHERQLALQRVITDLRDATAGELQQFAANKRAASSYRG